MFLQKHLQTALNIIAAYDAHVPFAAYLKQYFASNKKHGSKDRRFITQFCYAWFRLGKSLPKAFEAEQRMKLALWLSENAEKYEALFDDKMRELLNDTQQSKLAFAASEFQMDADHIFPLPELLSSEIDTESFNLSLLQQPDVFLRARPGKKEIVSAELTSNNIEHTVTDDCIRLNPAAKTDEIIQLNRDAVIQDASSQQTIGLADFDFQGKMKVWDCCAASGGKTIAFADSMQQKHSNVKIHFTVTDVRESIIRNLKQRFKQAGINNYNSHVADLSLPVKMSDGPFDLIICDAPCSGSGTWGRTPEQLLYFDKEKIAHYTSLQRKITTNAAKHLKQGGLFLYITCSVFEQENEAMVDHISAETGLILKESKYFKGYHDKADTLFAAVFTAS